MRILYITDALAVWGGIERVLRDKMDYLVEHGYEVHVVTTDQGPHEIPYPLDNRIIVHDLGIQFHHQYRYRGIKRVLKFFELERLFRKRLKEKLLEVKPDVIVCIRVEFVNAIVDVKGTTPLVCESHSMCNAKYYEEASLWYRFKLWLSLRKMYQLDMMVALTDGDARDWKKYCKNVCVIPNVVCLNETGKYSDCLSKKAIFAGRFSRQKDIESLFEIWKLVHKRHPDWELNAYGEGEQWQRYEELAKHAEINMHVYPPSPAIFDRYRESSILLMTSLYEPFGLVLPEAMSCGFPVVAFNCPYGPADIIADGKDGFLIEGRNVFAYAEKICQLIENLELRQKMGHAAILSSRRYEKERIMPKWISLFDQFNKN